MKKPLSLLPWKKVAYYLITALVLIILISPKVKIFIISVMMKVGFLPPPTENIADIGKRNLTQSVLRRSADGKIINTAELKGKVLMINFWATWCPPCVAEMPSINKLYLHYKSNSQFAVIPVDVDGNFKKAIGFMQENGYNLPVYQIIGRLPDDLMSDNIPTTVIINKGGKIIAKHQGAADYTDISFHRYIDRLLKE